MTRSPRLSNGKLKGILLLICTVPIFLISLGFRKYFIPVSDFIKILFQHLPIPHMVTYNESTVVLDVRLPRLIMVALVGAALQFLALLSKLF